jgi:hypothetical protein
MLRESHRSLGSSVLLFPPSGERDNWTTALTDLNIRNLVGFAKHLEPKPSFAGTRIHEASRAAAEGEVAWIAGKGSEGKPRIDKQLFALRVGILG